MDGHIHITAGFMQLCSDKLIMQVGSRRTLPKSPESSSVALTDITEVPALDVVLTSVRENACSNGLSFKLGYKN